MILISAAVDACAGVRRRANLRRVQPAAPEGQRSSAVQPDDDDLVVHMRTVRDLRDELPVARERAQKAPRDVVERHVVVARHDQLREVRGPG